MQAIEDKYAIEAKYPGGQAIVYKARDKVLNRTVAIKVPDERTRTDQHRLDRFIEEGRKLARLNDENVITVLHFIEQGEVDDNCYLVTEWMDKTLADVLAGEKLEVQAAVEILCKILSGLRGLHAAGIVHRDLKPGNIYISSNGRQVKIGDLGIASDVGKEDTLMATPKYVAPEIYRTGATIDRRTDLYSLGILAYEMLLGKQRFESAFHEIYASGSERTQNARWLNWHLDANRTAPPLKELAPEIPDDVSAAVERMMSKNPDERFTDAETALRALSDSAPGGVTPLATPFAPLPIPDADDQSVQARLKTALTSRWMLIGAPVSLLILVGLMFLVFPGSTGDPATAEAAGLAMEEAYKRALEAGADQPPELNAFHEGEGHRAEGNVHWEESHYDLAEQSFIQAKDLYDNATAQAWQRQIDGAKADAAAAREAAVAAGGSLLEAESRQLPAGDDAMQVAEQAATAAVYSRAIEFYTSARDAFALALKEIPALEAWKRLSEAREAALAAGADQPPELAGFQEGEAKRAEGAEQRDRQQYDLAEQSFVQATEKYDSATVEAWQRRANESRAAAASVREQAVAASGGVLEAYSQNLKGGDEAMQGAEQSVEAGEYSPAIEAFSAARAAYELAVREVPALQAWDRLKGARSAALEAGVTADDPGFQEAEELSATGTQAYKQGEYSVAAGHYDRAAGVYANAMNAYLTELASQAGVAAQPAGMEGQQQEATQQVFLAGSTPEEIDAAVALCRQYSDSCPRSWYASEVQREARLTRFEIDKNEVTNREFAEFVQANNYITGAERSGYSRYWLSGASLKGEGYSWRQPKGPGSSNADLSDHPVVHVTWRDADAYCRWKGGRLPTEDEWEYMARGMERRTYPWGKEWDGQRLVWRQTGQGTRAVGSLPAGATPQGVNDLAGNVWEWTSTRDGDKVVLKGGSWAENNPANLRTAARRTEDADTSHEDDGFRCVRDGI